MTAPKKPAEHGRTPENTPIPGGGAWTRDAESGAWAERVPPDAAAAAAKEN